MYRISINVQRGVCQVWVLLEQQCFRNHRRRTCQESLKFIPGKGKASDSILVSQQKALLFSYALIHCYLDIMKLLCPDLSTLNIKIWLTAPPTRTTTHLYLRLVYLLHHIHINISNSGTSFFFRYRIFLCILAKSLCHYNYIPFIFISMTYNDELSHSMNSMKATY